MEKAQLSSQTRVPANALHSQLWGSAQITQPRPEFSPHEDGVVDTFSLCNYCVNKTSRIASEDTVNRVKRQLKDWGKILPTVSAHRYVMRGPIQIYEEQQLNKSQRTRLLVGKREQAFLQG